MKVAAVIVLFHPDTKCVISNIEQFISGVDKLIIWNNSSEFIDLPEKYNNKIIHMGNGMNDYIAKPLNKALEYCVNEGYDYLLTMDQDSTWKNFNSFIKDVYSLREQDVVIYAPNVNHINPTKNTLLEVESTITSGSLCNVILTERLGGFREDYKIYWVDGEFCYRARLNGFKIKVLTCYDLNQKFGKETKTKRGFFVANYTYIVYYFLFRNMMLMRREYRNVPSARCIGYTSLLYIGGIILGEKNKFKKLLMVSKGLADGMFQRLNVKKK